MKTRAWGVVVGGLFLAACSQEKADAIEVAAEVRALCKEKKNDEAAQKGAEMYEANPVFKLAVDSSAATWKVKDIANYNYCGPSFVEASRKMAEHSDSEGCGCHVVGDNRRDGALWLLVAFAGAVALRRSRRGDHRDG